MEKVEYMEQAQQNRQQLEMEINNLLITLTSNGFSHQYIGQICAQTIRPFNTLNELAPNELQKVKELLQSLLQKRVKYQMNKKYFLIKYLLIMCLLFIMFDKHMIRSGFLWIPEI